MWDPVTGDSCVVMDLGQHGMPYARAASLCANDEWCVVGGFTGSILLKQTSSSKEGEDRGNDRVHVRQVGHDRSGSGRTIINHVAIAQDNGETDATLLISCNDNAVRMMPLGGDLHVIREHATQHAINVHKECNLACLLKKFLGCVCVPY